MTFIRSMKNDFHRKLTSKNRKKISIKILFILRIVIEKLYIKVYWVE